MAIWHDKRLPCSERHPHDIHLNLEYITLLQGDEGIVEIHQEHVGPDQHEAVGPDYNIGANLSTESVRAQA